MLTSSRTVSLLLAVALLVGCSSGPKDYKTMKEWYWGDIRNSTAFNGLLDDSLRVAADGQQFALDPADCQDLADEVRDLDYQALPTARLQHQWSRALAEISEGATRCANGLDASDAETLLGAASVGDGYQELHRMQKHEHLPA